MPDRRHSVASPRLFDGFKDAVDEPTGAGSPATALDAEMLCNGLPDRMDTRAKPCLQTPSIGFEPTCSGPLIAEGLLRRW